MSPLGYFLMIGCLVLCPLDISGMQMSQTQGERLNTMQLLPRQFINKQRLYMNTNCRHGVDAWRSKPRWIDDIFWPHLLSNSPRGACARISIWIMGIAGTTFGKCSSRDKYKPHSFEIYFVGFLSDIE